MSNNSILGNALGSVGISSVVNCLPQKLHNHLCLSSLIPLRREWLEPQSGHTAFTTTRFGLFPVDIPTCEQAFHIHREPYNRFFLKYLRSSDRSWLASQIPRIRFGSSWLLCAEEIVRPGCAQRTEGFGILASPHPFWISLIGDPVWFYSNSLKEGQFPAPRFFN